LGNFRTATPALKWTYNGQHAELNPLKAGQKPGCRRLLENHGLTGSHSAHAVRRATHPAIEQRPPETGPGNCPEVGFEEVAIDFLGAPFWTAMGSPEELPGYFLTCPSRISPV